MLLIPGSVDVCTPHWLRHEWALCGSDEYHPLPPTPSYSLHLQPQRTFPLRAALFPWERSTEFDRWTNVLSRAQCTLVLPSLAHEVCISGWAVGPLGGGEARRQLATPADSGAGGLLESRRDVWPPSLQYRSNLPPTKSPFAAQLTPIDNTCSFDLWLVCSVYRFSVLFQISRCLGDLTKRLATTSGGSPPLADTEEGEERP